MLTELRTQLKNEIESSLKHAYSDKCDLPEVEIQIPAEKIFGEFSCNIAMKSAKIFKKSPLQIAEDFAGVFNEEFSKTGFSENILKIEVKAPGFINFYLKPKTICQIADKVFGEGKNYGKSSFGNKEKLQIEFVSANPTGPLSVAHARQAAVGDALGNILNFIGFEVTKEYYVNDGGNQIRTLGKSVQLRAEEILEAKEIDLPEECYQGEYIKDIAQQYCDKKSIKNTKDIDFDDVMSYGRDYLLDVIKKDLSDFGVNFDVWTHESKVATKKDVEKVLEGLKKKSFLYEKDGALWFKSTDFGDDKDRVLRKSDGSFTYLAPDIVYHKDKFDRGFSRIFNIWGPDHHGYIPRIKAAAEALGHAKDDLLVLIVQLATIYRNGEAVSMSTRKGQFISLREVIDDVGVDAARFFFMMRHISAHLDFDLELAKKQSSDNPVFYVQYAHARINSINAKAKDEGIEIKTSNISLLKEEEELDLLKKIGSFEDALRYCYDQLDPYPMVNYLQELATCFHKFYDKHIVVGEDKSLSSERLALINAAKIVLANGLALLGLSAPEKM